MVQRLMDGGSIQSEAEQMIAGRKTAFNKASREPNATRPINTRKSTKNSKPVHNESPQNGN